MFIRFRKISSDGKRPKAVAARIACVGYCQHRVYKQCPMKPRCRWRIGQEEQLAPYRLKVILVENKRVNGKVKQETIAVLGSIEGALLPEFWEGINRKRASKIKAEDWEIQCLRARIAFWEGANRRLKKLANRLGPDMKRLRIAAHERVPWPKEPERKKLELLEAKADFDLARSQLEASKKIIPITKKLVKKAQENLAESEALARFETRWAADAAAKLAKLSTRQT